MLGGFGAKGKTGLIVAIGVVALVFVLFPPYRVFFAVSFGLGCIVAGLLYLRNKYSPITEADVETKKPLGLE